MRFQLFLSLITYLAFGIVSLTVWTKKSEARIGCSYKEINNLEKMVSSVYALDEINEAIQEMRSGSTIRAVVCPNSTKKDPK